MTDIDSPVVARDDLVGSGKILLDEQTSPDWFRIAFQNSSVGMAITDKDGGRSLQQ